MEFRELATEVLRCTPTLEGLPMRRAVDPDYMKTIQGIPIEESANLGGAHFAKAMGHDMQICSKAITVEASKKYALDLEEKCARSDARICELEAKLKTTEEALKTKEVELANHATNWRRSCLSLNFFFWVGPSTSQKLGSLLGLTVCNYQP